MSVRFDRALRQRLIELAEETIREGANGGDEPELDLEQWPEIAARPEATFVTVHVDGRLNGCIGTLTARQPLACDIATNAYRAAFADPRFPPVKPQQVDLVTVHLSVLGPLQPLTVLDEADLLGQMRVGIDGIVLDAGDRRGTFLPAVWAKLPEPRAFLGHLKRKAGIGPDEWPRTLEVFRFEVEEFDRSDIA